MWSSTVSFQMKSGVATLRAVSCGIFLLLQTYLICRERIANLTMCLYCLVVNRVDNLALHVFQQYYGELCQALSSSLKEVATVLYSKRLVSRKERDQALEAQRLTPMKKTYIPMQAIERRILTANSTTNYVGNFCDVLRRHHSVRSIVSRMKSRLGD